MLRLRHGFWKGRRVGGAWLSGKRGLVEGALSRSQFTVRFSADLSQSILVSDGCQFIGRRKKSNLADYLI